MNKRLQSIVRKLQHFDGRQWCGCLIPSEIMILVENGALVPDRDKTYAKSRRDKGNSLPYWFYFDVRKNSALEKILAEAR